MAAAIQMPHTYRRTAHTHRPNVHVGRPNVRNLPKMCYCRTNQRAHRCIQRQHRQQPTATSRCFNTDRYRARLHPAELPHHMVHTRGLSATPKQQTLQSGPTPLRLIVEHFVTTPLTLTCASTNPEVPDTGPGQATPIVIVLPDTPNSTPAETDSQQEHDPQPKSQLPRQVRQHTQAQATDADRRQTAAHTAAAAHNSQTGDVPQVAATTQLLVELTLELTEHDTAE